MADLEIVHRGSLSWLWWVVAIAAAAALLWGAASLMQGSPTELETEESQPALPAEVTAVPAGAGWRTA